MSKYEDVLEEEYVEPNISLKHFYVNICKDWLKSHGIPFWGTVSELRHKIQSMKNNTGPQPILKRKQRCSVILINKFIGSLLSMISSIMNVGVHDDLTDLHIVQSQVDV